MFITFKHLTAFSTDEGSWPTAHTGRCTSREIPPPPPTLRIRQAGRVPGSTWDRLWTEIYCTCQTQSLRSVAAVLSHGSMNFRPIPVRHYCSAVCGQFNRNLFRSIEPCVFSFIFRAWSTVTLANTTFHKFFIPLWNAHFFCQATDFDRYSVIISVHKLLCTFLHYKMILLKSLKS